MMTGAVTRRKLPKWSSHLLATPATPFDSKVATPWLLHFGRKPWVSKWVATPWLLHLFNKNKKLRAE